MKEEQNALFQESGSGGQTPSAARPTDGAEVTAQTAAGEISKVGPAEEQSISESGTAADGNQPVGKEKKPRRSKHSNEGQMDVVKKADPPAPAPRGLHQKLLDVMAQISPVAKLGFNEFDRYAYVMEDTIANALRPLLAQHGVLMIPSCEEMSQHELVTTVKMKYTLIDPQTGQREELFFYGQGSDRGDKGVYKAYTGAEKYALTGLFLIGSTDDPESEGSRAKKPTAEKKTNTAPVGASAAAPGEPSQPSSAFSAKITRMRREAASIKWDVGAYAVEKFGKPLESLSVEELQKVDAVLALRWTQHKKDQKTPAN